MNIFDIILAIAGFFIGLFVWSAFWGTLFATLPIKIRAKNEGKIKSIKLPMILGQLLVSMVLLAAMLIFVKPMFYGSLIASVVMLFNIPKLRREAIENMHRDHTELHK